MAATTKLSCTFETASGNSTTLSYKYADSEVSTSAVKSLITGIITNGDIFKNAPVKAKSAKLVTTQEEALEI